ncbi:hypothetical protein, partial [Sinorhizobium meliloti]|uniref:hypothetical protein n=1 Tax=Rhizobium meliloti TaxID=382 RepID=UPI001AEC9899
MIVSLIDDILDGKIARGCLIDSGAWSRGCGSTARIPCRAAPDSAAKSHDSISVSGTSCRTCSSMSCDISSEAANGE